MNPWFPFNDVAMPKFPISHEPMLGPMIIGIITKNISLTPWNLPLALAGIKFRIQAPITISVKKLMLFMTPVTANIHNSVLIENNSWPVEPMIRPVMSTVKPWPLSHSLPTGKANRMVTGAMIVVKIPAVVLLIPK